MSRRFVKGGNPNAQNRKTMMTQVSITAPIPVRLISLLRRWLCKLHGVGVPIIAVDFNNQTHIGQEEIAYHAIYSGLGHKRDIGGGQERGHSALWLTDKGSPRSVVTVKAPVVALNRAKPDTLSDAALGSIERLAAFGAYNHRASFALVGSALERALRRAIGALAVYRLSANRARMVSGASTDNSTCGGAILARSLGDTGGGSLGIELFATNGALDNVPFATLGNFCAVHPAPCGALNRTKPLAIMAANIHEWLTATLTNLESRLTWHNAPSFM